MEDHKVEESETNKGSLTQYTAGFTWFFNIPEPLEANGKYAAAYRQLQERDINPDKPGECLPGIRESIICKDADYDQVSVFDLLDFQGMPEYMATRYQEAIEAMWWKEFKEEMKRVKVQKLEYVGDRIPPTQAELYPWPTLGEDETTLGGTAEIDRRSRERKGLGQGDMIGRKSEVGGD